MTMITHSAIRSTSRRQHRAQQIRKLFRLHQQRNSLSLLSDRMLRDIGVSREEALRESRRPVWDLPQHWLR